MPQATETVLIISDCHFPFSHKDTFEFLTAMKEKYEPTRVISIGDEGDFHALSDYNPDPDGDSAGKEFRRMMKYMHRLYDLFPDVQACTSNHTSRPFRRAYKYGIPRGFLKDYAQLLEAPPGWSWADRHEIDGVIYEHGEGLSGELGAIRGAKLNMQSTVIGHIHSKAGVLWHANPRYLIFGFNVGCLVDKETYAMAYGKVFKDKPVISAGIVQAGIPMLVPMQLKGNGRWVGQL